MYWLVEWLKVGFSGFVAVVLYFGYRLLSQEQKNKSHSAVLMAAMRRYMNVGLLSAGLVAVMTLVSAYLRSGSVEHAASCRDALGRLETQSRIGQVTMDELKIGVRGALEQCRPFAEGSDE